MEGLEGLLCSAHAHPHMRTHMRQLVADPSNPSNAAEIRALPLPRPFHPPFHLEGSFSFSSLIFASPSIEGPSGSAFDRPPAGRRRSPAPPSLQRIPPAIRAPRCVHERRPASCRKAHRHARSHLERARIPRSANRAVATRKERAASLDPTGRIGPGPPPRGVRGFSSAVASH